MGQSHTLCGAVNKSIKMHQSCDGEADGVHQVHHTLPSIRNVCTVQVCAHLNSCLHCLLLNAGEDSVHTHCPGNHTGFEPFPRNSLDLNVFELLLHWAQGQLVVSNATVRSISNTFWPAAHVGQVTYACTFNPLHPCSYYVPPLTMARALVGASWLHQHLNGILQPIN
jgi:hypothetical protein